MRRRLLAHAAVLGVAGLACLALSSTSTSAAPTVQDGRYLEGGDLDVTTYQCEGADAFTQNLLTSLGLPSFGLGTVTVRSAAVEPSPSPGEDFDMEFTWDFTLSQELVDFAISAGTEGFSITGTSTIGVVSGATGPDSVGTDGPSDILLGDGSVPVGYTHGPFTATYNRTAAVDEPIVFAPEQITAAVTTSPSALTLNIVCTAPETLMTLNDVTGEAPTTTTTTRPQVVPTTAPPATQPTDGGVGGTGELPATGTSSNLFLVFLAIVLIDIGYLALSASRSTRGQARSVS
jgi:hypothetical protein